MRENAKLHIAKMLRGNMTDVEQKLWYQLRAKRFYGLKFKRQATVEGFIPDFVCMHPPVIIELDGGQHVDRKKQDEKRDEMLRTRGYTILRFWNNDVLDNMEGVLLAIKKVIESSPLPHPSPARGRGEKKEPLPTRGRVEMQLADAGYK